MVTASLQRGEVLPTFQHRQADPDYNRLMTRLYLDCALEEGAEVALPSAAAHHLRTVLRLEAQAELEVFNAQGQVHLARLVSVHRSGATVLLAQAIDCATESPLSITLVQSISRGERMDYTLQKAVELGVTRIVPVISKRTVVRLDHSRTGKRLQHWRGVIQHAAEQSGRCVLPALAEVIELATWTRESCDPRCLVLHPAEGTPLSRRPAPAGELTLIAGPEGGFDHREIADLTAAGASAVSLGPRILRTETAAVCALAVCQALWGDLA